MTTFRFASQAELESSNDLALSIAQIKSAESGIDDGWVSTTDLLASHHDALLRTCRPGHLTGSALVVDAAGERVLLLFHTKLQKWLQPGGHADGDANLAAVALREATEETGIAGLRVVLPAIDLDIHSVDPPAEDAHDHHDLRFLVIAPAGAVVATNHESQGSRWVTEAELTKMEVDEGTRRLARVGLAAANAPKFRPPASLGDH